MSRPVLRLVEQPTDVLPPLPVTTVYAVPRVRLQRRLRRIARSHFAADVRAAALSAFWPAVIGCGVIIGLAVILATRGQFVTWHGTETIPTGGTQ